MFTARQTIEAHQRLFKASALIAEEIKRINETINECIDNIIKYGELQDVDNRPKIDRLLDIEASKSVENLISNIYQSFGFTTEIKDLISKAAREIAEEFEQQAGKNPSSTSDRPVQGRHLSDVSGVPSQPNNSNMMRSVGNSTEQSRTRQQGHNQNPGGDIADDQNASQGRADGPGAPQGIAQRQAQNSPPGASDRPIQEDHLSDSPESEQQPTNSGALRSAEGSTGQGQTRQQGHNQNPAGGIADGQAATQNTSQGQTDAPELGHPASCLGPRPMSKKRAAPQRLRGEQTLAYPAEHASDDNHAASNQGVPSTRAQDDEPTSRQDSQASGESAAELGLEPHGQGDSPVSSRAAGQSTGGSEDGVEGVYQEIKNKIKEFCDSTGINPSYLYKLIEDILNRSSFRSSFAINSSNSAKDPLWNMMKKSNFDAIARGGSSQEGRSGDERELIKTYANKYNEIVEEYRASLYGHQNRGYYPGDGRDDIIPQCIRVAQIKRFLSQVFSGSGINSDGGALSQRKAYPRISSFGRATNIPLPDRSYTSPFAVVVVDTSGSMSLDSISSIVVPIIYSMISERYDKICLINFDATLQRVQIVGRAQMRQALSTWYGRGGTNMGAALSYVMQQFISKKINHNNYPSKVHKDIINISHQIRRDNLEVSSIYVITDCYTGGVEGWQFPESEELHQLQISNGYPSLVIFNLSESEEYPESLVHHQVKITDLDHMTSRLHYPVKHSQSRAR